MLFFIRSPMWCVVGARGACHAVNFYSILLRIPVPVVTRAASKETFSSFCCSPFHPSTPHDTRSCPHLSRERRSAATRRYNSYTSYTVQLAAGRPPPLCIENTRRALLPPQHISGRSQRSCSPVGLQCCRTFPSTYALLCGYCSKQWVCTFSGPRADKKAVFWESLTGQRFTMHARQPRLQQGGVWKRNETLSLNR